METTLNTTTAGATVRTVNPLMEYDLLFGTPDVGLRFRWTNFHWPESVKLNVGSSTLAAGHYNMMGEARGEVTIGGRTTEFCGAGFSDHSWGVRRRHLPASRSYFAVFDPEFYLASMPVLTEAGEQRMLGYVRHGGKIGRIGTDSRLGYSLADDWISVTAADSHFFDEHDRGFHIVGCGIGKASSQTMGHGKLVHHVVAEFECGGRMGRSILETSLPKQMRPEQARELGLDADSWWLNEGGA